MDSATALFDLVFRNGQANASLIDKGTFPDGWVDEYLRLLDIAKTQYSNHETWPRSLVGALYFTLTHLPLRYEVWQQRVGRQERNLETERRLERLAGPTRVFLAMSFLPIGDTMDSHPR